MIFIAVVLCVAGSRLYRLNAAGTVHSGSPVSIYLEEPTGLSELSEILVDSGVTVDKEQIEWAGNMLGWRSYATGHYVVDDTVSISSFLARLARGIQDPVTVTIPPGSTETGVAERLVEAMEFDSTQLTETLQDSTFWIEAGVEQKNFIGRMYPDTYSFYWTSPPDRVLKRILEEFEQKVAVEYQEQIEETGMTTDEVITMASIVEWEANFDDEKERISGVYWNRLDANMYLQADPTVNYAVGERRRLLYRDYQSDHEYNTYTHKGLPPGPITNPGRSSIEAALEPDDHEYYYMVASPEGNHVFSRTYEEHQRESAKWQKWIQEQYRIKEQRERETSR